MYHALFWSVTSAVRADSVGLFDLVCALSMNILYAYLIHKKYLKNEKGRERKNKKRKEREGKSKWEKERERKGKKEKLFHCID